MSRLYGAKVDEKRWKVVKIDNGEDNYDSYKLVDKKNEKIYIFRYIIGLEQVSENEFLIFKRANYDDFEIDRYRLHDSKTDKIYSKKFSQFHYVSDDRILFTYWGNTGPYRFESLYSVKENKEIDEANWLMGCPIEVYKEEETQNIKLYVEEEIPFNRSSNSKVLFSLDPNTLQPNSFCYSQLRDIFIKVNNKEEINEVINDDRNTIQMIEELLYKKETEKIKNAKKYLLTNNE